MTILVTGARGRVGRAVLDALLAADVTDLRASRRAGPLEVPAGVETVVADLEDPATLGPTLDGVEQAFLYATPDGVAAFVDTARTAGVEHVVLLSSAAVSEDDGDWIAERHRAAEKPLVESGLTATLLRPGAFASNTVQWAGGIRAGTVELPYPDSHVTPIHEADIADVAVSAFTHGAARGEALPLSGPESLTFREQVAVVAAELDRDITVTEVSPDLVRERMAGRAPAGVADTLLRLWAATDGVPQPVEDVSRITGRPGRTFAQWVREHRAAIGG